VTSQATERRRGLVILGKVRRAAPAVLSLLLVVLVAGVGFAATRVASDRAQSVHVADRSQEQTTLAGLGTQYVLFGLKEELNYSSSHSWSLRRNDPADVGQLSQYAGQSALLGYGAALVDPATGAYVSSSNPATGLPPVGDPGMAPLLTALRAHGPGLSLVMHVGAVPLVGYGVPLTAGGTTVGFVGFSRLDQSPLESYVTRLRYGSTGVSYVLDSNGVAIASSDPSLVGKAVGNIPPVTLLHEGKGGFDQYGTGATQKVATFDPIKLGGWGVLTTQSTAEFYGPIRSGILRVEGALVLFLVVAAGLIAVFNYRRHVALRREMRTVEALADARERFRHAFEETPVGMALIDVRQDSRGRFLQANQALCQLSGYSESELVDRNFQDLVHRDNAEEVRVAAGRLFSGDSSFEIEIRLLTKSGGCVWGLLHGSLIRDVSGRSLYGVAHVQDVSDRKAAEEQLEHLALHDALTGLPNRVLVSDQLARALDVAGRNRLQVGVLYLDLDNFKEVNDRFGHAAGDRVLQAVAERLRLIVRPGDTPGRLGGDEFVVVCGSLPGPAEAMDVAERLEAAVSEPIDVGDAVISITASTGISIGGGAEIYGDHLLRDADAAMYLAKQSGRGRVCLSGVDG
jgi:diguanylate cyclase (GGDEF)-like protein/PAS domain S-box-containing protein